MPLDVEPATALRPDGHHKRSDGSMDCLHYCMPGPLDQWAAHLYNVLLLLGPPPSRLKSKHTVKPQSSTELDQPSLGRQNSDWKRSSKVASGSEQERTLFSTATLDEEKDSHRDGTAASQMLSSSDPVEGPDNRSLEQVHVEDAGDIQDEGDGIHAKSGGSRPGARTSRWPEKRLAIADTNLEEQSEKSAPERSTVANGSVHKQLQSARMPQRGRRTSWRTHNQVAEDAGEQAEEKNETEKKLHKQTENDGLDELDSKHGLHTQIEWVNSAESGAPAEPDTRAGIPGSDQGKVPEVEVDRFVEEGQEVQGRSLSAGQTRVRGSGRAVGSPTSQAVGLRTSNGNNDGDVGRLSDRQLSAKRTWTAEGNFKEQVGKSNMPAALEDAMPAPHAEEGKVRNGTRNNVGTVQRGAGRQGERKFRKNRKSWRQDEMRTEEEDEMGTEDVSRSRSWPRTGSSRQRPSEAVAVTSSTHKEQGAVTRSAAAIELSLEARSADSRNHVTGPSVEAAQKSGPVDSVTGELVKRGGALDDGPGLLHEGREGEEGFEEQLKLPRQLGNQSQEAPQMDGTDEAPLLTAKGQELPSSLQAHESAAIVLQSTDDGLDAPMAPRVRSMASRSVATGQEAQTKDMNAELLATPEAVVKNTRSATAAVGVSELLPLETANVGKVEHAQGSGSKTTGVRAEKDDSGSSQEGFRGTLKSQISMVDTLDNLQSDLADGTSGNQRPLQRGDLTEVAEVASRQQTVPEAATNVPLQSIRKSQEALVLPQKSNQPKGPENVSTAAADGTQKSTSSGPAETNFSGSRDQVDSVLGRPAHQVVKANWPATLQVHDQTGNTTEAPTALLQRVAGGIHSLQHTLTGNAVQNALREKEANSSQAVRARGAERNTAVGTNATIAGVLRPRSRSKSAKAEKRKTVETVAASQQLAIGKNILASSSKSGIVGRSATPHAVSHIHAVPRPELVKKGKERPGDGVGKPLAATAGVSEAGPAIGESKACLLPSDHQGRESCIQHCS